MNNKSDKNTTTAALNSFLRGEISAVETYGQAIEKISDPFIRQQLEECQRSHQMRVDILREEIEDLGGQPSESSGAWGTLATAYTMSNSSPESSFSAAVTMAAIWVKYDEVPGSASTTRLSASK